MVEGIEKDDSWVGNGAAAAEVLRSSLVSNSYSFFCLRKLQDVPSTNRNIKIQTADENDKALILIVLYLRMISKLLS